MPELPEIETITQGIQNIINLPITDAIIRRTNLRYPIDANLHKTLLNNVVTKITRRSKYIIMHLKTNNYLIWHLGMSGSITTINNINDVNSIKNSTTKPHDHVDIIFDKQIILRYNDPRRFGCILLTKDIITHPLLVNLGPEPLTNDFTAEYLAKKLYNKKSCIKQLIMNNQIVVGVGNIYASEALFKAKISPLRNGETLTTNELKRLVDCIKDVLIQAIELGGSSLRDYKQADGKLGYFQNIHQVYGKAGQSCKICKDVIIEKKLGQRNSFYCPTCQK